MNKRSISASLAAAAALTLTACVGNGQAAQAPAASQLASDAPSASIAASPAKSSLPAAPTYELLSSQSDEELAKNTVGLFSEWAMAGATPEMHTSWDRHIDLKDYAAAIAKKNVAIYAPKVFGADYATLALDNPSIQNALAAFEKTNRDNLIAFVRTDNTGVKPVDQNANNIEPWKQESTFESVVTSSKLNGQRDLEINLKSTDNRAMNLYGGTPGGTVESTIVATYSTNGASAAVSTIKFIVRGK